MNPYSNTPTNTFLLNPIVRKLYKIEEKDGTCATYAGVRKKTMFFMLMVLVGAAIGLVLHVVPFGGITDDGGIFVSYLELGSLIVSLVFILFCTLLALFAKKTTPVTGSLSCIGFGIILASVSAFFPYLRGPMLLAAILTFALVITLLYLYFSQKVYLSNHFRVAVTTLFGTAVVGSLILGVCFFIPAFHDTTVFIQNNPLISILVSMFGIMIAALFLLIDFESTRQIVERELPAKYEWMVAYALAFTVIWLYLKVLNLMMAAQRSQRQ